MLPGVDANSVPVEVDSRVGPWGVSRMRAPTAIEFDRGAPTCPGSPSFRAPCRAPCSGISAHRAPGSQSTRASTTISVSYCGAAGVTRRMEGHTTVLGCAIVLVPCRACSVWTSHSACGQHLLEEAAHLLLLLTFEIPAHCFPHSSPESRHWLTRLAHQLTASREQRLKRFCNHTA